MFHIDRFGLFAVSVLLINLTPGATFVAVTSGAVSRGVKAGMLTVAGAFCGLLVYAVACWAGLSKIIAPATRHLNICIPETGQRPEANRHQVTLRKTCARGDFK